jgi:hypothetical protein
VERELLELQILVAVAVAVAMMVMEALEALALSSCLYQLLNTQAQPQAHQLSQLVAQTQF